MIETEIECGCTVRGYKWFFQREKYSSCVWVQTCVMLNMVDIEVWSMHEHGAQLSVWHSPSCPVHKTSSVGHRLQINIINILNDFCTHSAWNTLWSHHNLNQDKVGLLTAFKIGQNAKCCVEEWVGLEKGFETSTATIRVCYLFTRVTSSSLKEKKGIGVWFAIYILYLFYPFIHLQ